MCVFVFYADLRKANITLNVECQLLFIHLAYRLLVVTVSNSLSLSAFPSLSQVVGAVSTRTEDKFKPQYFALFCTLHFCTTLSLIAFLGFKTIFQFLLSDTAVVLSLTNDNTEVVQ